MTKREIMEVLEDIASLRETQDIPLSCVEKYLDMLDDNSVVTVKSFCGDIPGEYVASIENTTEEDLYNNAGLL